MTRKKAYSGVLVVCVVATAWALTGLGSALAQHQHQGQSQASTQSQQTQQHAGMMHGNDTSAMMCTPEQMQQMTKQMSENPEMLKKHLTMMVGSSELRPVLVKLLKDDADMRQTFESLLSEAKR